MSQAILNVNGQTYMNTRDAGSFWDMKPKELAELCKTNQIENKFKSETGRWFISVDEYRPLKDDEIYAVLLNILNAKNDPNTDAECAFFGKNNIVSAILRGLAYRGYIRPNSIKDAISFQQGVLTRKGMEYVLNYKPKSKWSIDNFKAVLDLAMKCIQLWSACKH